MRLEFQNTRFFFFVALPTYPTPNIWDAAARRRVCYKNSWGRRCAAPAPSLLQKKMVGDAAAAPRTFAHF